MTDNITMPRQTVQQLLESFKQIDKHPKSFWSCFSEIAALEAVLKQPVVKESLIPQQQAEPDRRDLQAAGTHPAPCARHCEAKAFEIEIRSLKSALEQQADPTPPDDESICADWITASDTDGIEYDGPSFERGYKMGQIDKRDAEEDGND